MNSTLSALIVELFGRVNLGEGALDNMTYEAASMLVVDVCKYNVENGRTFKSFLERPITSILMSSVPFLLKKYLSTKLNLTAANLIKSSWAIFLV